MGRPRLLGATFVAVPLLGPPPILAGDDRLYPPDAIVEGMSFSEWLAVWSQWFLSIPPDRHPINDSTGELCGVQQSFEIFSLLGAIGGGTGPLVRDLCVAPCGKPLLIPFFSAIFWAPGDCDPADMSVCRAAAKDVVDPVFGLECAVDGTPLSDLDLYRFQSPVFDFTVPEENMWSLPPPLTRKGVADGYFILVRPLPAGKHTIQFNSKHPLFNYDLVTYHLTVACDLFFRGDANADGKVDIADPIVVLERLFLGGAALGCEDAADVQDDGKLDITDPIYALNWLFLAGPALAAPGPELCGPDSMPDELPVCSGGC